MSRPLLYLCLMSLVLFLVLPCLTYDLQVPPYAVYSPPMYNTRSCSCVSFSLIPCLLSWSEIVSLGLSKTIPPGKGFWYLVLTFFSLKPVASWLGKRSPCSVFVAGHLLYSRSSFLSVPAFLVSGHSPGVCGWGAYAQYLFLPECKLYLNLNFYWLFLSCLNLNFLGRLSTACILPLSQPMKPAWTQPRVHEPCLIL